MNYVRFNVFLSRVRCACIAFRFGNDRVGVHADNYIMMPYRGYGLAYGLTAYGVIHANLSVINTTEDIKNSPCLV